MTIQTFFCDGEGNKNRFCHIVWRCHEFLSAVGSTNTIPLTSTVTAAAADILTSMGVINDINNGSALFYFPSKIWQV